jgi:hypothetical protein
VTAVHRCERGARCHAHERLEQDGQQVKLGAQCDRPLCDTCERAARRALDDAPSLYVQLRNHTLVKAAAVRSEMVTASRTHSLPVNGQALHLGEQLWWLLVVWEDEIRRIASASPRPASGRREGRQVADAARFLAAHLTAWIAAPVTPFQVTTGHDPSSDAAVEQCGWEAVAALIDWRSAVRKLPGLDTTAPKAVKRYEQRCPACGVRAITHTAGDDLMQCQNCGATQEYMPSLPREADYREGSAA